MKKATDEQLRLSYERLQSCRKVSQQFGMCPQSVHERLSRLGVYMPKNVRPWTADDDAIIIAEYPKHRAAGTVKQLAMRMGREYFTLATRASKLGLGDSHVPKRWLRKIKDETHARQVFNEFKRSSLGLLQFCAKYGIDPQTMNRHIATRWPDEWEAVIESKAPQQSRYRLGRAFEYQVRDLFTSYGYFVLRSARSLTIVDLVAIKKGSVVLLQCKRSGTIISPEWNQLYDLASSVGATPVLAERPTGRGINLWIMTGRKDGRRKPQPREAFRW